MSFRSNLNSASTPSSRNVNPSANPQVPQSIQVPYPYYPYSAITGLSTSAQATYIEQSELVRVYPHHFNDDQLHSFSPSSSSTIPITSYTQSGVSATNTGAMQMGHSDMSPSDIPATVPHMPYIRQSYPLANAAPQLIMSTEVDARSGVNTTARDINIDMNAGRATSNTSLPNFLPKSDAALMENSHLASQQTNNDFHFSTIPITDSGVSSTFPESSQRTLLENSLQSMAKFSVGRQDDSSVDTSIPETVPQMYANPTMGSFHSQSNYVTPSNNMQFSPSRQYTNAEFSSANNSDGYVSLNLTHPPSYTWSADTNPHTLQDPNSQEFLGAAQGTMTQPNGALQFHPSTPHYPTTDPNLHSFASPTLIASHSNPAGYSDSELLYGQINTMSTSNDPTISTSNSMTFSTNTNRTGDYRSYNGSYSDSGTNEHGLQVTTNSPYMDWSPNEVPYGLRNSHPAQSNLGVDRFSTDTSSQSLSRDSRPFIRCYSEMTIPSTHASYPQNNGRSNSTPMVNYTENIHERPQFIQQGLSFAHARPTPLRTPTSLRNDTLPSSSLNEQPLLKPPFLVGSSPLPQTTTSALAYGTPALQGSSSPINDMREESATPTPNNTSARLQQQSFNAIHDRKRREMLSTSNDNFTLERMTNQEFVHRAQMNTQEVQGSPQTPVYPRLPSFSNFPPLSSPLPQALQQSSTSQSVLLSRAYGSDISRAHVQSFPDARFQGQRKRQRDMSSTSDNASEDEEFVAGTAGSEVNFNNDRGNNDLEARNYQRDWQFSSDNYMYDSRPMDISGSMATTAARNSDYSTLTTAIEDSPLPIPTSSTNLSQSAPYQESDEQNASLLSAEQNSTETTVQSEQTIEDPHADEPMEQMPAKKVKLHQCSICKKFFPRPSGLATHMNSHSGARPYKCSFPYCAKTFAVRSNARRHMRTHGVPSGGSASSGGALTSRRRRQRRRQSDASESESEASDGELEATVQETKPRVFEFEPPVVMNPGIDWPLNLCFKGKDEDEDDESDREEDEGGAASGPASGSSRSPARKLSKAALAKRKGKGKMVPKLKWVPQSLQSRTNASRLRSISPGSDMWDIDADAEGSSEDDHKELPSYQPSSSSSSFDAQRQYAAASPSHNHAKIVTTGASASSALPRGNAAIRSSTSPGKSVHRPLVAPAPLPPVAPSSSRISADLNAKFEERNSYAEAGTYPYHPSQWRTLPGPALVPLLRG